MRTFRGMAGSRATVVPPGWRGRPLGPFKEFSTAPVARPAREAGPIPTPPRSFATIAGPAHRSGGSDQGLLVHRGKERTMSSQDDELEQARAAAQAVLDRVKTDEAYAQRLRENPAQALLEAGMPSALLGAALQE